MSLIPKLEELKQSLRATLENSDKTRVGEELHNLFGQFHARTILKTLARVLLDAGALMLCGVLLFLCLESRLAIEPCTRLIFRDGIGEQCFTHGVSLLLLAAQGVLFCIGSFVSTKLISARRFQHSTLVSAALLFALFFFGSARDWDMLARVSIMFAAFLCCFAGYRLALVPRKKGY